MRSLFNRLAVLLMTFSFAAPAYAIFDAQLMYGMRSGKIDGDKVDSTEIGAAVHVDPIPLVPIAFGLYANSISFKDKEGGLASDAKGLEAGLQLYGWFPVGIAGLKPYAKASFPMVSAIKSTSKVSVSGVEMETDAVLETSGMHLNFGVGYSVIPLVSLFFEVGLGQQKIQAKEFKVDGQKQDLSQLGLEKEDYKSTAYILGIEVGL